MHTRSSRKSKQQEKLKPATKELLKKRREMVKKGTVRDNIENAETCKTMRKKMRRHQGIQHKTDQRSSGNWERSEEGN